MFTTKSVFVVLILTALLAIANVAIAANPNSLHNLSRHQQEVSVGPQAEPDSGRQDTAPAEDKLHEDKDYQPAEPLKDSDSEINDNDKESYQEHAFYNPDEDDTRDDRDSDDDGDYNDDDTSNDEDDE